MSSRSAIYIGLAGKLFDCYRGALNVLKLTGTVSWIDNLRAARIATFQLRRALEAQNSRWRSYYGIRIRARERALDSPPSLPDEHFRNEDKKTNHTVWESRFPGSRAPNNRLAGSDHNSYTASPPLCSEYNIIIRTQNMCVCVCVQERAKERAGKSCRRKCHRYERHTCCERYLSK